MANLGSLVAAGISAKNENTLALANLNFDFSLVKIDAPKEFLQLGKALSPWRRKNAEEGSTHRTARKLGALFEQAVNPPEELVTAYGRRASEISRAFDARQAGKQFGPFSDHAGADTMVLWAAAVSGKTAIAVALLACMLARIWDAPKAISIWDELVQKRKEQIQEICDGSELSHQALIAANRQDITRKELAEWDASARSWLGIADGVKKIEHQKMEAVLLKLSLPVDNSKDVFTSVTRVWKTAMTAMENLCKGVPQRVHNGAVLLAITSWHLYPDVEVFGRETECVIQNDVLVSPGGRLTVGLEDADPESAISVHWSLSLANLRFYGDPVLAASHVRDASRISFKELTLVCLGSLFAAWRCEAFDPLFDQEKGAKFIVALWESLERIASDASPYTPKGQARFVLSKPSHWLRLLASAASELLENNRKHCATARKLVSLGSIQGSSLVHDTKAGNLPPYFGLLNARVWPRFALFGESVRLLRELAKNLELDKKCSRATIHLNSMGQSVQQFATVFPLHSTGGLNREELQHVRWILESETPLLEPPRYEQSGDKIRMCSPAYVKKHDSIVSCARVLWTPPPTSYVPQDVHTGFDELHLILGNENEGLYAHPDIAGASKKPIKKKRSAQKKAENPIDTSEHLTYMNFENVVSLLEANLMNTGLLTLCLSDTLASGAFAFDSDDDKELVKKEYIPPWMHNRADFPIQPVSQDDPDSDESVTDDSSKSNSSRSTSVKTIRASGWDNPYIITSPFTKSMCALSIAADIWLHLPDATISLNVTKRSLWLAPWVKESVFLHDLFTSRKKPIIFPNKAFSCIVMLETGNLDILPSQLERVFAISIRNTIYAAAALLTDPYTYCPMHEMRMIYGNVGRPGVSLMIPPADPVLRKPKLESWMLINHEPFTPDGKCEDMFGKTSLHLAFTGYEQPVLSANHGARDLEACYLETVIAGFDGRERVGDLDILRAAYRRFFRLPTVPACSHFSRPLPFPRWIVVDSWDELLGMPSQNICIIRAHGNALSRLATAAACAQIRDGRCFILPPNPCYSCVVKQIVADETAAEDIVEEEEETPTEYTQSVLIC
ncbi:hypothetical protein GGR58DRAFT_29642 [Xylaria digitata]|nr:hypothetical protein GGR58DRAFT_29642 [Xylaria digitata]